MYLRNGVIFFKTKSKEKIFERLKIFFRNLFKKIKLTIANNLFIYLLVINFYLFLFVIIKSNLLVIIFTL
jgi:hypothetical protein